jgi:hypothetical protein
MEFEEHEAEVGKVEEHYLAELERLERELKELQAEFQQNRLRAEDQD